MMSANWLRRLDRWLGSLLVMLLAVVARLRRQRRPLTKPDEAVLFIQLSEMGSVILAEPALKRVAGSGRPVCFVILARNAECLGLIPWLSPERIFLLRDHSLWALAVDSWRCLSWCRQQGVRTVVDLELFSRFSVCLSFLSGAPRRVGFDACANEGMNLGGLNTDPVWYNPHLHMSLNYLALTAALEGNDDPYYRQSRPAALPRPSRFPEDPVGKQRVSALVADRLRLSSGEPAGAPLVLVQVAAEGLIPQRNWPRGHWVACCRQLAATGARIVLCGRAEEWREGEVIRQQVGLPGCVNLCGEFALAELPLLYRQADLLLTADSGPAHFASVTELPVVVLFGPETPTLFRPLGRAAVLSSDLSCSPCVTAANHRRSLCRDNQCMQVISPDAVVAEALRVLQSRAVVPLVVKRG